MSTPKSKPKDDAATPRPLSRANMRRAANTWFDLFAEFGRCLVDSDASENDNMERLEVASRMADRALEIFEEKWPGVYL